MKFLSNLFLSGLKVVIPFLFTVLILYWIVMGMEGFFRWVLLLFIDEKTYAAGMGWLAAILFIFAAGLVLKVPFVQGGISRLEELLRRLPFIKTLFNMASDTMGFLSKKGIKQGKVVVVKTPLGKLVGIATREDFRGLPENLGNEGEAAVYFPMSYQIGGYTFVVPQKDLEELDISVQDGMGLVMTAGVSGSRHE